MKVEWEGVAAFKLIIHKAFKRAKIEIYCYLRYLLSRFDFAQESRLCWHPRYF